MTSPTDVEHAHARFVAAVEDAWQEYLAATTAPEESETPAAEMDEGKVTELRGMLATWRGVLDELRVQADLGTMEVHDRVAAAVDGLRPVIDGAIARLRPKP